jgi:hydrogenase-4 membrane subunit HyfE
MPLRSRFYVPFVYRGPKVSLSFYELLEISAAITAIMMLGSTQIRTNLLFYSLQTAVMSALTAWVGCARSERFLLWESLIILLAKSIFAPWFLRRVMARVGVESDAGTYLSSPLCMHLGIVLLVISYVLAEQLPTPSWLTQSGTMGGTASFSLIFIGMLLMVTRKIAVNQVIGFLVIENGIYLFSLTQTGGLPILVEMGVLLDLLVGIMIAGLLLHRIKKSFEHIDVTKLTGLRD